ncbi:MAG: hypothetical protein A3G34_05650 [Candidatus Lindowbacteria bacterium RIFCSPLOWO2_12_FULL_62_27]|nr:MAG: hypothetical protein A3G34_05650 [Candidatus Lindowbacteria bacterium RIFCSPLOWO2_12_FULL_62_27]
MIVALAMLSVLTVLSVQYTRLTRNASERSGGASDQLAGFYAAEAGLERVKARLGADTGAPDWPGEPWADTHAMPGRLNGWAVAVHVTDEEGKINLNAADPDMLSRLFEQFGLRRQERDILSASLLDWIDSNDLHRLNGAESDYYKSKGLLTGARNAPLDAVEEILQIRGAPADLLDRTARHGKASHSFAACVRITGDTRVNLNTAPPPVMLALGFTKEEVARLRDARAKSPWTSVSNISSVIGDARAEFFKSRLTVSSSWFLVESTASRPGAQSVSVFARLLRAHGRIYTAGFWA